MIFQKFVNFVEALVMSTYQDQGILAHIAMVKEPFILKYIEKYITVACFIHPEKGIWKTPKGKEYWSTPGNARRAWTIHHLDSPVHWIDEGYKLVSSTYSRGISLSYRD